MHGLRKFSILVVCLLLCGSLLCTATAGGGEFGADTKYIALTFDDGPSGQVTQTLLDGLRSRYVSATFFLCGYRMEQYPQLVQQMAEDGHELAIHGMTHAFLQKLSPEDVRKELDGTNRLIEKLTGQRAILFRPPGGLINDTVLAEATREQLPIILWSVDPEDWKCNNPQKVARFITRTAKDGDIILMHDLSQSSVSAALMVIDQLENQGFLFVTVSELAVLRNISLEPAKSYWNFAPQN